MAHAAISTSFPLQVRSGNTAAALVVFVPLSGGMMAADQAAAESLYRDGPRVLVVIFLFFRVLFVNFGTAGLLLDTSCTLVLPK